MQLREGGREGGTETVCWFGLELMERLGTARGRRGLSLTIPSCVSVRPFPDDPVLRFAGPAAGGGDGQGRPDRDWRRRHGDVLRQVQDGGQGGRGGAASARAPREANVSQRGRGGGSNERRGRAGGRAGGRAREEPNGLGVAALSHASSLRWGPTWRRGGRRGRGRWCLSLPADKYPPPPPRFNGF